jgi:hypothetical protein
MDVHYRFAILPNGELVLKNTKRINTELLKLY